MTLALTDFAPPAAPAHLVALGEATAIAIVAGNESWRGEQPQPGPRPTVRPQHRGRARGDRSNPLMNNTTVLRGDVVDEVIKLEQRYERDEASRARGDENPR